MPTDGNQHTSTPTTEAELAQAFKDLAKGESTASAMENQLTSLEKKIDDLLASVSDDGNVPHRRGENAADTEVAKSDQHSSSA